MSRLAGRKVAIGAGSLAVLLGALDAYVVVTIMRDIMHDVGIPINQLQRITPIVTMYLLGYIAAMPLLGKASDRFGRKRLLQVSLAMFMVGSVITALSVQIGNFDVASMTVQIAGHPLKDLVILGYPIQNFHVSSLHVLIAGRTVQGVASGALLPVTLALGADLWAQRNRAAVLGGIGAAQELGSVLGPLYGILIVWLFRDWRDVFWITSAMLDAYQRLHSLGHAHSVEAWHGDELAEGRAERCADLNDWPLAADRGAAADREGRGGVAQQDHSSRPARIAVELAR